MALNCDKLLPKLLLNYCLQPREYTPMQLENHIKIIFGQNAFENFVWKMSIIFSMPWYVKRMVSVIPDCTGPHWVTIMAAGAVVSCITRPSAAMILANLSNLYSALVTTVMYSV